MEEAQKEFILYLQSHPEYYAMSQDPLIVGILSILTEKGKYVADIIRVFPGKTEGNILDALYKLEKVSFVSKLNLQHGNLYYQTERARIFIKLYKAAKGSFTMEG